MWLRNCSQDLLRKRLEILLTPCELEEILFFLVSCGAVEVKDELSSVERYTVAPGFFVRGQVPTGFDPLRLVAELVCAINA